MIKYKGKEYPCRTLYVRDEEGDEFDIDISVESLATAISPDSSFENMDELGENIDMSIYFYIPDDEFSSESSEQQFADYCYKNVDLGGLVPVYKTRDT